MLLRMLCTACDRKTLRVEASGVATIVVQRTCKCGARYQIVCKPIMHSEQRTIHSCNLTPLKSKRRTQ